MDNVAVEIERHADTIEHGKRRSPRRLREFVYAALNGAARSGTGDLSGVDPDAPGPVAIGRAFRAVEAVVGCSSAGYLGDVIEARCNSNLDAAALLRQVAARVRLDAAAPAAGG